MDASKTLPPPRMAASARRKSLPSSGEQATGQKP
jgi:hypothetical protein